MASDSRAFGWYGADTVVRKESGTDRRRLRRLRDGLVFSGFYIAVIAALEVVLSMLVLDLAWSLAPFAVGCITFTIYANDRLVDADTDAISNPRRTAFVNRHRQPLSAAAAVAYGVALTIAVANGPLALVLALFPAAIWVLYAVKWTPRRLGSVSRLKEVFLLNSLLVAVAWGVTVVLFPIAFAGAAIGPAAWILVAYFAVGTFAGAEISNARDVSTDEDASVATLPARFGLGLTMVALYGVAGAGLGILAAGWAAGLLGTASALALGVGLVAMGGVVAGLDSDVDHAALSIFGECARLPSLAIMLVVLLVP